MLISAAIFLFLPAGFPRYATGSPAQRQMLRIRLYTSGDGTPTVVRSVRAKRKAVECQLDG
jgi:hypothetical protein